MLGVEAVRCIVIVQISQERSGLDDVSQATASVVQDGFEVPKCLSPLRLEPHGTA